MCVLKNLKLFKIKTAISVILMDFFNNINSMYKNRLSICSIFLFAILFYACNKIEDVQDGNYEAEFAIPLFQTETSLKSILDNLSDSTYVTLGNDGIIKLNYEGNLVARSSNDIFELFSLGAVEVNDTVFQVPYELPNSIDINLVRFKDGTVVFNFKSFHEQDVQVNFTIPQLSKNGEVFSKDFTVVYDGMVPIEKTGIYTINDYELTSDDNNITILYEAIKADGVRDTLSQVIMAFANFEFSYAEGFLGTDIYEIGVDTIPIDFFQDWITGDIYFVEPQIYITVVNSFGFPVRSLFHYIEVLTVDGTVLPLESIYINNSDDGFLFEYPGLDEIGETKETVFSFNNQNSNIDDVLGSGPLEVRYDIDGLANPTNVDNSNVGFMTCESELKVQVAVELPIYGQASGFAAFDTLQLDTFDLNLDFGEYGEIDWAEFKLVSDNGLPLDVYAQVYFLNDDNNVIDSLLDGQQNIIAAAPVNAQGQVEEPFEKITYITMTSDRLDKIRQAKNMVINTSFFSYNNGSVPVKIFANDAVELRMGVKLGVHE